MKKNAQNSRPGSSTPSRRAPATSTTRDYRSATPLQTSNKSTSNRGTKATPSSKKGNGAKIFGICAVSAVLIAGVVAGCYFLKKEGSSLGSIGAEKYSVTLADGTVAEMTADEMKKELNTTNFFNGISIDGIDMSGKTKDEALSLVAAQVPAAPVGVDLNLDLDGTIYPVDLSTLTLASNYAEVVDNAYNYARPADTATDEEVLKCYQDYQSLKSAPVAFTTAYTVNTDGLSGIVHGLLDPLNTEMVEAQVTSFNVETLSFDVTESKDGYEIDIDKAVSDTKALLDAGVYQGTVTVDAVVTKPTLSTDDVLNGFGLISETSSKTTDVNSRNHNIKITCEVIDGMILQPGEQFSFNGIVGERTVEKGYELAGTIQAGKTEPGLGGGICQLSTMIYQSAVKADLQVDERNPHQWPSGYADTGTDAAVDWPSQDLKFTNSSEYPIAIHATYDVENRIVKVQLYGHVDPNAGYIKIEGEVLSTSQATTEYVANATMAVGTREQTRSPHNMISATSYKVYYDANGNEINRVRYLDSYYGKINALVEVGVLNPDGTLATLDTTTGEVTSTYVDPETTETTAPSDSGTTESTVTTDPVVTDPVVTDPAPTDPAPTDPAPTDPAPVDP